MTNETAQEVAILFALRWDYQYILSFENDQYIGGIAENVEISESGLVAAIHLVGIKGINLALRGEIPWSKAKDGNGVEATEYMEEMGGYDLSCLWGGIE